MSANNELACAMGRRDEVPNQELARKLAAGKDSEGIREIVEGLGNKDRDIQNDCIKVLYEIGYIAPELIGEYVLDFLKLLPSRNNRLAWGGMIALATIADLKPFEIAEHFDDIKKAIESGSVITVDNGVKVLAKAAAAGAEYNAEIFPYLIEHLLTCRPKEVAQHAESTACAVNEGNKDKFSEVLNQRLPMVTEAQAARIQKLLRKLGKR